MDIKEDHGVADFKLIIGLGNPTETYENTYHNIGIFFVSEMLKENKSTPAKTGKNISLYKRDGRFFGIPSCYMNLSGLAVKEALRLTKIPISKLLIIHDDSDLPAGSYRLSFNRGSAGHKGIESIFTVLETREFWRARIGIRPVIHGKPTDKKAADFVLKKISLTERKKFQGVLKELEAKTKLIENAAVPSG